MKQIIQLSINTRVELQTAQRCSLIPPFKRNQALKLSVYWGTEGTLAEKSFFVF